MKYMTGMGLFPEASTEHPNAIVVGGIRFKVAGKNIAHNSTVGIVIRDMARRGTGRGGGLIRTVAAEVEQAQTTVHLEDLVDLMVRAQEAGDGRAATHER